MGFSDSDKLFSDIDANGFGKILMAASDLVLIVNKNNMILDACFSSEELFAGGGRGWKGRNLSEIVTPESNHKFIELTKAARKGEFGRRRQVNHQMVEIDDVPVSYQAISLNDDGDVALFGLNTSQIETLQRRLMSSQLAMEREAAKLRHGENRYRALFQLSRSPQILLDAASLKIIDINSLASILLGGMPQKLENRKFPSLFDDKDGSVLHKILLAAVNDDNNSAGSVKLKNGNSINIRVSSFSQDGSAYLLLHLDESDHTTSALPNTTERKVLDLVKHMPDGFVVTNSDRRIIIANNSFLDMMNLSNLSDLEGEAIDNLFERPGVDCNVLLSNVKEHGVVHRFASSMRTQYGKSINVEISACQLDMDGEKVLGFWTRPTNNIIMGAEVEQEKVTRSNEQIANLVGHMPLKDIVRETTDMIERLCIETALELTRNNRASAAQMLGVSRQSLYSKMGKDKDD